MVVADHGVEAPARFYEDVELDQPREFGEYLLTKDEVVSFASRWDPQPFHIDEAAAEESVFGGLSACSAHCFAILSHLLYEHSNGLKVLAGLGVDQLRLRTPARPGDRLRVRHAVVAKRVSASRPGTGIIKSRVELVNQNDELILESFPSALIARRPVEGG